jgi:hypothetical protein
MAAKGLDRAGWQEKLRLLGQAFRDRGCTLRLEIIGSWSLINAGMPARSTVDLDVWAPMSQFDVEALESACAFAGLDFDPMGEVTRPYVQVVQPGIVSVPEHTPIEVARWGGLILLAPPPAALAATKLTRAEPQDIADIFFLRTKYGLVRADVATFVELIPSHPHREVARENLVYLDTIE